MPDWFTHTLISWNTGKITKINIELIVIGALIPDFIKINIAFAWFRIDHHYVFDPFHTPIGAIIIGGIIALFFKDSKKAFIALGIGITTHFILDFFLVHVSGGMRLLFPFSWGEWQFYLIRSDDYFITLFVILTSVILYLLYYIYNRKTIIKNKT